MDKTNLLEADHLKAVAETQNPPPPLDITAKSKANNSNNADKHTPIHANLGGIICKYKWYLLVQLLCIIITVTCCIAIPNVQNASSATVGLTWESYFAINCVMATILMMLIGFPPDLVLVAISVLLTLTPCTRTQCYEQFQNKAGNGTDCSSGAWNTCTIISMKQAWRGFQSTSVLSIAVLFMVAKGVEKTGIISYLAQFVLGNPRYLWLAILRMCLPVSIISAFINDTPVVAVMMPIIEAWAVKTGTPVSKLMIPLSYAALLGGMCTLTGTSTNLVLQGLVKQDPNAAKDHVTVTMFEMTPVGVCVALSCIVYMSIFARYLLPNHHVKSDHVDDKKVADAKKGKGKDKDVQADRQQLESVNSHSVDEGASKQKYVIDVVVRPKSKLVGKRFHETYLGVRDDITRLPRPLLAHESKVQNHDDLEIENERNLQAGDVLLLATTLPKLCELRYNRDIELRRQQQITATLKAGRRHRHLFEVVVAPNNPLVGRALKENRIHGLHEAEVVAVGYKVGSEIAVSEDVTANHVVEAYDQLIIESYPSFYKNFQTSSIFHSINQIEGSTPPRNYTKGDTYRMLISGLILIAMIVGIVLDSGFVFEWAIVASYLLIWTQCLTVAEAYKAVKGRVILGILAAMGLGASLENTGVALAVAQGMVSIGTSLGSPFLMLCLIYYCVALLSCVAGNQATVIILYPIVSQIVVELKGWLTLPQFVVVLIMGASSSFMSPFSYQTNLMVWSAGKYKFVDYPKFGGPMTILAGLVTGITSYWLLPLTLPKS